MKKLGKTMAVLLSLVMMGTMPGAVSSITAYGAQTSESEDTATLAAASGLGVESHTQEEIIKHIKDSGALITDDTVYKTNYSAEQPYSAGVLDESTLNSGIAMLNNIRYIAGLNCDVALDDGFNEECQAGALINKINGSISHYPQQPSDMSDEMYQLAYKGCNESNIAWGYSTLNKCIVFGWMSDDDDGNISRVGHRAWCLNPTMGKTGFGVVDNYYNMHSFDGSHTSSVKNISWPAQNMPVEYFEKNMPWSIFTGSSETASDVKVTLTRQSDGRVWNFSQDSADGYFNCTNYIQNGTIVFRPGDITGYNDGDVFTVSVTGVKTPFSYTVSFFSLGSELGHVHSFGKSNFVVTSVDIDAMTLEGTMACDSCGQKFYSTEGTITNLLTSNVTCGFKGYIQFDFTAKLYGLNWQGTNFYYINGLPHKYGEVEFTWDGTDCTADAKCSRCGDVVSEECTVTSRTTATCTSDGVTIYTAEYDGKADTKTVDTPATGHSFTDYVSDNNATYTADGTKTAKCNNGCGATDTIADEGSKLTHKFTKYVSNNDATCQADGTKTAKCDYGCGATDTIAEEGSKLDHKFTKYIPNNDATCKNVGTKTAECDYGCGTTDTVENADDPQKEHSFTNYISDNNATCQADGTKTAECDYGCGMTDTIADEGSKLDHKFTKYIPNNDATCKNVGTKTAECDYGCGTTDTVENADDPQKEHSFTNYISDNNATCQADGTKTAECDYGCGMTDTIADKGSRLSHKFTKYVSNNDATCQADGTKTAKCDYGCGEEDTITDEGSKLDHKFTKYIPNNDATCKNVGTKTAKCDYGCGVTDTVENADDPQKEHSFTNYISDNNATCQKDGTKTAMCDNDCGERDTIVDKGSRKEHTSSGKWEVSTKATDKVDGMLADKCTECGQIIDSRRIPQIKNVKLAYTSCTYNGTAKKPGVTVYDIDGNTLNKIDYTVSYKDNTASGAAGVTVTFKGNYAGSITATFVIYPKAVSIKTAQSTAKGVKLTWNRAANGTGYIVYRSVNGSSFKKYKTINSLSTISMVDSGAKKSGTKYAYKIYVYKSVNGKVYNSAASAVKLTYYMAAPAWKTLTNSFARAMTVKYGQTSGATGYQIQYAGNNAFKNAKIVTIQSSKVTSKTIANLQKKKYYVRMRCYKKVKGVTYYSSWSGVKSVSVRK